MFARGSLCSVRAILPQAPKRQQGAFATAIWFHGPSTLACLVTTFARNTMLCRRTPCGRSFLQEQARQPMRELQPRPESHHPLVSGTRSSRPWSLGQLFPAADGPGHQGPMPLSHRVTGFVRNTALSRGEAPSRVEAGKRNTSYNGREINQWRVRHVDGKNQ